MQGRSCWQCSINSFELYASRVVSLDASIICSGSILCISTQSLAFLTPSPTHSIMIPFRCIETHSITFDNSLPLYCIPHLQMDSQTYEFSSDFCQGCYLYATTDLSFKSIETKPCPFRIEQITNRLRATTIGNRLLLLILSLMSLFLLTGSVAIGLKQYSWIPGLVPQPCLLAVASEPIPYLILQLPI